MNRSVVAIVQARMASRRFPGKSLCDLAGKPMLWRVLSRASIIPGVRTTVAALPDNEPEFIESVRRWRLNVQIIPGHPTDLLARFDRAVAATKAEIIMRLTADNPAVSGQIAALVLQYFHRTRADYVSNMWPTCRWPEGTDVEVFSREIFERAVQEATDPLDREHVTRWILRNGRCLALPADEDWSHVRWTVDYIEDLAFLRWAFARFGNDVEWRTLLGYCRCGCGRRTARATRSSTLRHWRRGLPKRYYGRHGVRRPLKFWEYVEQTPTCWLWTGRAAGTTRSAQKADPYGVIRPGKCQVLAHRFSYALRYGEIPPGMDVLHRCDIRRCVRPEHLYVGDDSQNQRDFRDRKRATKITAEQAEDIRVRVRAGVPHRAVAVEYGVSESYISMIASGHRWAMMPRHG